MGFGGCAGSEVEVKLGWRGTNSFFEAGSEGEGKKSFEEVLGEVSNVS